MYIDITIQQLKTNKLLVQTTTSMNLKGVMLSERSQSLKVTYYMIQFT